jgi:hypothetical protein
LGIVEVALIRKDIYLLLYLYEHGIPNVCKKLRALMISEKIESKSREAYVQVVEVFALEYHTFRENTKATTPMERKAVEVVSAVEFGRCLAILLELCTDNVDCMVSYGQIFSYVFEDAEIRSKFCRENGIEIVLKYIEVHTADLNKKIGPYKKRMKFLNSGLKGSRNTFDSDEEFDGTDIFAADFEVDVKCVCI